ncbi:MAG: hypothetical protein QM658_04085 [Gordonia sp. (in: high G+C Gram-positive bacteria)]
MDLGAAIGDSVDTLAAAVGHPVRRLDYLSPGPDGRARYAERFSVEFDGWPWRLSVATRQTQTRGGQLQAVIVSFSMEPVSLARSCVSPDRIGKRTLQAIPLVALEQLAAAIYLTEGQEEPTTVQLIGLATARARGGDDFYREVADVARRAREARDRGESSQSMLEFVADVYATETGPANRNTVQGWLHKCRQRGYLERERRIEQASADEVAAIPEHLRFTTRKTTDEETDR